MPAAPVKAWSEIVIIPTYPAGPPDKNPLFLEKRVYQGSSGAIYPLAMIDRVSDVKEDRPYTAVFLENEYLKIMILPEIGGRVQMALDKTNDFHFVYYNRVIKPALVGLAGPWISGGIEFNWPQHHRPSTFAPLDWRIEEHADGSRSVWCSEIERLTRTQGQHGFRLYPQRAYLEINVQLYNRTAEPQTFLWWANPAVPVHDDYQSVFPPDVHAVMDHGKRAVSDFPIATGTYYKVNYAPGTDISRYKNIPVPTSYMAFHSDFDFVGSYDHARRAGMLHVANHHVVPGKKQWTWGCGDFGQAWDRQLTDEDGPYIELMCGAYTDNQPDFSWLQPGEEKRFTQVFMPYKHIGPPKNASREAAVNLEVENGQAQIGVYLSARRTVLVTLECAGERLYSRALELSPENALVDSVELRANTPAHTLTLRVLDGRREMIAFTPLAGGQPPIPAPASPAPPPAEVATNEELYLHGLHLEQYRHATYAPEPYYIEALRRDPGDARSNNALGRLLYRRGRFAAAEPHFRAAIARLTWRNPNPYDGEPYYNLGLALRMQGRFDEAYDAFYKATWNAAWQDAAWFELARLAGRAGHTGEAHELLEQALSRNTRHYQARHLKTALLRRQGETQAAQAEAGAALELTPLNYGALWEKWLLCGDPAFEQAVHTPENILVELALDYAHAGLFADAATALEWLPEPGPLALYTLGWVHTQAGLPERAAEAFRRAAAQSPAFCFPNRLEDVLILETALHANPADGTAAYALGNFWYAHRQSELAIAAWEQARAAGPNFPTVHRNLGLAYYNKRQEPQRALKSLETAFALDPTDGRVLFELDQLYKKLNRPPPKRLALLEQYPALIVTRADLALERITLLNLLNRPEDALAELTGRVFHPWEGGEGKVTGQYVAAQVEIARKLFEAQRYIEAIQHLEQARIYPPNLGEGKLYGARENHIFYYLGRAYEGLGEYEQAIDAYEAAAQGEIDLSAPMFYNDQPPDQLFYQGLARRLLGQDEAAESIFKQLIAYGQAHSDDPIKIDYFAVSLPDFLVFETDLALRNRVHCLYLQALGHTGLGNTTLAEQFYAQALALDAGHLGATLHRRLLEQD